MSVFFRVFGRWLGNSKTRISSPVQDNAVRRRRSTTSWARRRISDQSTSGVVTEVQWTVPRSVYGGTGFFTDEQDLNPKLATGSSEFCGEMQRKLGSFREESAEL